MTVRVRGIYATALTLLLRRMGYIIVDVSRVLQERLGLPLLTSPAEVTVKSTEERPDDILVFGYPWSSGEKVAESLLEALEYAAIRRSRLGNNTLVAVRARREGSTCMVELPDGRTVPGDPGLCPEQGEAVRLATVIHDPPGGARAPIVRPVVRLVGYYAIITYPGEGISLSEHIRDQDKITELYLAAAGAVDTKKYHVHLRSNSRHAQPEQVEQELKKLLSELEQIASRTYTRPEIVRQGEFLALITVPRPTKDLLDKLRAEAYPTIPYHHSLKSFKGPESTLVDCAETALQHGAPQISGAHIAFYLIQKSRRITIEHIRPDGSRIRLGPFTLESARLEDDNIRVVLQRTFTTPGMLDGLGAYKEPGDRSRTLLDTGKWYTIHEYTRSDGRLIGVYANVNTPPEVGEGRIKYMDLYIDVVKRPGSPAEVIDEEELEEAYSRGLITEKLYKKALETADKLVRYLDSQYP